MVTIALPYAIKSYTVIVHEAEEGGYWGEILELPGCVSQGETIDEFRQNIREALEAILELESQVPRIDIYGEPILAEKGFVQFIIDRKSGGKVRWVEINET